MKNFIYCLISFLFLSACNDPNTEVSVTDQNDTIINRDTSRNANQLNDLNQPQVRVELDLSERKLYVLKGSDTMKKYDVAVGSKEHPTPTGDFTLHKIDWNPDWNPTDSEWAEDRTAKKPGEKGNPMGRARIVYNMPYTLHGTDNLQSLGKAVSHGSVRVANENIIELGKLLMQESGTTRDSSWFNKVLNNPNEMVSVELNNPIPLKNKE